MQFGQLAWFFCEFERANNKKKLQADTHKNFCAVPFVCLLPGKPPQPLAVFICVGYYLSIYIQKLDVLVRANNLQVVARTKTTNFWCLRALHVCSMKYFLQTKLQYEHM